MSTMTMRQRVLAVLHGDPLDRVPFVQYDGTGGPTHEVWAALGRDSVGVLSWTVVHRHQFERCRWDREEIQIGGRPGLRTTLHTPAGDLVEERQRQPDLGVMAVRRHFIREPQDYRAFLAYLRDRRVVPDIERAERVREDLGEDGLPHIATGRTPFQELWVQWVSAEDLCLHMVDCPELVGECMELMRQQMRQVFDIVRRARLDYVVVPDNITAPVIGERWFRQYCLPLYNELAERVAHQNARVFVHMDGDLKPLWQAIGESQVGGIDSLSPPPDNDTSVADAIAQWPDMRLWVNFPSSVHLAPAETVYATACRLLEEGGHTGRLQIQISENVPPGAWRKSFPQIIRAIHDFGRP